MELFNYFRSSASYRVRIALALKGLDYDYRAVHLQKNEHTAPGYAALSAARLVPLLRDGDALVSQSLAIMEYLDEVFMTGKIAAFFISDADLTDLSSLTCEVDDSLYFDSQAAVCTTCADITDKTSPLCADGGSCASDNNCICLLAYPGAAVCDDTCSNSDNCVCSSYVTDVSSDAC